MILPPHRDCVARCVDLKRCVNAIEEDHRCVKIQSLTPGIVVVPGHETYLLGGRPLHLPVLEYPEPMPESAVVEWRDWLALVHRKGEWIPCPPKADIREDRALSDTMFEMKVGGAWHRLVETVGGLEALSCLVESGALEAAILRNPVFFKRPEYAKNGTAHAQGGNLAVKKPPDRTTEEWAEWTLAASARLYFAGRYRLRPDDAPQVEPLMCLSPWPVATSEQSG